jgi:uncharacterized C2H2 Zn-finger protein
VKRNDDLVSIFSVTPRFDFKFQSDTSYTRDVNIAIQYKQWYLKTF